MVVAGAIFIAEAAIMIAFSMLPPFEPGIETALDATALTLVAFPVLYLGFYKPFESFLGELKTANERVTRFATAIEQGAEAIVITDTSGSIQYVNPAFERLTGYTQAEAIGQNPRILKSGEHGPEFYKDMWSTIKSGKVWKGEIISRKKDGTFFYEDVRISPVKNPEGEVTNFVAVKLDITERKKAEWEKEDHLYRLRELSEYSRNLIENAPVGA